jgi:hypothetical protein
VKQDFFSPSFLPLFVVLRLDIYTDTQTIKREKERRNGGKVK